MQTVPISHRIEQPAHNQLGLGVGLSNAAHLPTSPLGRDFVHLRSPTDGLSVTLHDPAPTYAADSRVPSRGRRLDIVLQVVRPGDKGAVLAVTSIGGAHHWEKIWGELLSHARI